MLTKLTDWKLSSIPGVANINELLGKIKGLRDRFPVDVAKAAAYDTPRLALIDAELTQIKAAAKIDSSTGKVDQAQWDAKPADERRQLAARADQLFDELRCLTRAERSVGRVYFFIMAGLFAVVVVVYVYVHWNRWDPMKPPSDTVSGTKIAAVMRELRRIELEVADQRAKKVKETPKEPPKEEERKKLLNELLTPIRDRVAGLKTEIGGIDLSFGTLSVLGTVEGESQNGALLEASDSLGRLRAALTADLESQRAGFFWNDRIGRWFEIAWWAEFGVLVGILFYIAGLMGEGRFESENIVMFWTEIVIAPVVVLVIFFLFTLTGITGISPSETSLPGNIGFAFIFGFAIRRTLGLLDTIKKRILPDPTP